MMKIGRHFYGAYIRALLAASLAFGTAHGTQLFVVSAVESSNNLHVNPTAIFILPIFELPQSIVFFFVFAIFAYVPSIIAIGMLKQGKSNRVVGYVLCGTFIGLIFLPLCAGVAFVTCLLYTSPSPRDRQKSRMPS